MSTTSTDTAAAEEVAAAFRSAAVDLFEDTSFGAVSFRGLPSLKEANNAFVLKWVAARKLAIPAIDALAQNIDDLHAEFAALDAEAAAAAEDTSATDEPDGNYFAGPI